MGEHKSHSVMHISEKQSSFYDFLLWTIIEKIIFQIRCLKHVGDNT